MGKRSENSWWSQGKQSLYLLRQVVVFHCVVEQGTPLVYPMAGMFLKWQRWVTLEKALGMAPGFLLTCLHLTLRWDQTTLGLDQVACEYLQSWKSLCISGQPVPVFNQPCWLQPVSRSVCAEHKENMKMGLWGAGWCLYICFLKEIQIQNLLFWWLLDSYILVMPSPKYEVINNWPCASQIYFATASALGLTLSSAGAYHLNQVEISQNIDYRADHIVNTMMCGWMFAWIGKPSSMHILGSKTAPLWLCRLSR